MISSILAFGISSLAFDSFDILRQECKIILSQYEDVIMKLLMAHQFSKDLSQIGLCSYDSARDVSRGIIGILEKVHKKESLWNISDGMCTAYRMAIVWL